MRRAFVPPEASIAESWRQFRNKETGKIYYFEQTMLGDFIFPLYCDFVGRSEPQFVKVLSRREWAILASSPARIITMAELGIALETLRT